MDSRRDFLKKAAALAAAGGLPSAIQKAFAIEPAPGSTFYDAEHVVILMQENRSFDHCFGSLRGVRGFNDPRAVTLPNGNPVWLQSNAAGQTFAPFRLDLKNTNATWLGCLPHDWPDQSRTRNEGKHDLWLDNKRPGRQANAHLPLTLGFHTRDDLPFYYALADAFTVCDQNFCSSLTGTNPNRLHLWSGTIRGSTDPSVKACVRNSDAEAAPGLPWKTFPERLEELGIPWRVYQNELYVHTGLSNEATPWLGNFGDNALEYFEKCGVQFARQHRGYLAAKLKDVAAAVGELQRRPKPWTPEMNQEVEAGTLKLEYYRKEVEKWSEANWQALPDQQKELHRKAFSTNEADPHYRELEEVTYDDGGTVRRMKVPRGDVLHRFRTDVAAGNLPAVSWLVAPQMFSDHPDSPWYGAWYIAEALDILTSRPEVWRKTIFILCYDENDGYFDHIPPFVPPDPQSPATGKASPGLQTELEFVRAAQEQKLRATNPIATTHTGPIGLGYRVPLVIASPWSRGGYACSQVFDHTSILQFLEKFLTKKSGKPVRETNITPWRRAVCGDLTSAFRPAPEKQAVAPGRMDRGIFLSTVHRAQFKEQPASPRPLSAAEIALAKKSPAELPAMPRQEKGTRPACPLPYELAVHGSLNGDRSAFSITFDARRERFGERAAGAPFHVYAPAPHKAARDDTMTKGRAWSFAVAAGGSLAEAWSLKNFADSAYHLRVHGPNGFYREFRGDAADPRFDITMAPDQAGDVIFFLANLDPKQQLTIRAEILGYNTTVSEQEVEHGKPMQLAFPVEKSHGWYDVLFTAKGFPLFSQRFAGHLETGTQSMTDPLMGGEI